MTGIEARLVPTQEPDNRVRKEIALRRGRISLGRSPRNDVTLDDPEVSKSHAEILVTESGCVLRDLDSSNGTFVNGRAVKEHAFAPGDVVELGMCRFTFEVATPQERRSSVTIVMPSPIEKTQVLATSALETLRPGIEIKSLEVLRGKYDRVRTAFEAVASLSETTDIEALCTRILDVAFQLVDAETGAVLLFDAAGKLRPWASRGRRPGDRPEIVISRTVVDQVVREKKAVLASDALTDARWSGSESVVLSGMRSLMCVPLLSADNVYGLLHVGNSTQIAAFSQSDLELVTGIGSGGGVAMANAFKAVRLAEEAKTRESLGRFLSPVLLEQVMQNTVDLNRSGAERVVTVMFADIRGFTPLTERSKAADVVSLLNEFFDQMVEVVFARGGVLDKYIGDALMAVWGTPVPKPKDAVEAVAAGREMQETLASLNALRVDRGDDPINIGIGLATGPCVSGAIGARRRMDYTVVGDAVNLASRLAGIARGGQVLCDEATYEAAGRPPDAAELPPAQVKGKAQPVAVFQLVGPRMSG
jgi:adenylate cyclase